MRNIIVSEMISADGFFAGADGNIDWHVVGKEFNQYAIAMLDDAETLLFGRITYDMMAGFWPTPETIKRDPLVASRMNALAKIVFSKTAPNTPEFKTDWNNTTVLNSISKEEILKLKNQPGKDILILGSGTIVSAFAELGLIDEYRFIVNPVVLGRGKSLFTGISKNIPLTLSNTKLLDERDIILYYNP